MKDKLIKVKLVRNKTELMGIQFQLKSVVGALSLPSATNSKIRFYPGDYVSEQTAQSWVDADQTYEVTVSGFFVNKL